MELTELMLDDLVMVNGKIGKIKFLSDSNVLIQIDEDEAVNTDSVEPITLTTYILEKNGWHYNDEDEKFFPETWSGNGLLLQQENDGFRIVVTSDLDDEDTNSTQLVLKYVNELQHILKMRKIKKDIIL